MWSVRRAFASQSKYEPKNFWKMIICARQTLIVRLHIRILIAHLRIQMIIAPVTHLVTHKTRRVMDIIHTS